MMIEIDVDQETIDKVVVGCLRRTVKHCTDPKFADLYPDAAELIAACETLIEYYKNPED